MADLKGHYGIMANCSLKEEGEHRKGIFGWHVQGNGADSVAQTGGCGVGPG